MRNPFRRRTEPGPQPTPTSPPEPAAVVPLTAELEDEVRERAHEIVAPGFTERADAELAVEEMLDDEGVADAAAVARRVVGEVWARREAELAVASGPSDYDRLDRAYRVLDDQGIVARMSFTCCQTCGTDEIRDERTPADVPKGHYPWREWAFTFFHEQDAERLVEPDATLYLGFGSFRPSADTDPEDLAALRAGDQDAGRRAARHTDTVVGRAIRDALLAEGLDVDWDGDPGARIQVAITDWRKPLP